MRPYTWKLAALIFALVCCLSAYSSTAAQSPLSDSPLAVPVLGAAERLNAGDLESALDYWDDDGLFYVFGIPPTGVEIYSGKGEIRAVFEENIASHFREEVEILEIVGDAVTTKTTTWHDFTRQLGLAPMQATEVYVIQDGKIASLTWIISEESLAKLAPALADVFPPEPTPTQAAVPDTPVSAMRITFADGRCSYDGPMTIAADMLTATMDVEDENKARYGLTFHTLAPDKTLPDLVASQLLSIPPSWGPMIRFIEAGPGETRSSEFEVSEGPVYVMCWSKYPELVIGALGPFEVGE